MKDRVFRLLVPLAVVAVLAQAGEALGCATCFGKSDSALAKGMNMGIFALLIVVICMWSMIISFFVFLARRSSGRHGDEGPDRTSS